MSKWHSRQGGWSLWLIRKDCNEWVLNSRLVISLELLMQCGAWERIFPQHSSFQHKTLWFTPTTSSAPYPGFPILLLIQGFFFSDTYSGSSQTSSSALPHIELRLGLSNTEWWIQKVSSENAFKSCKMYEGSKIGILREEGAEMRKDHCLTSQNKLNTGDKSI